MNERLRGLYPSLVGSSTEYRFKNADNVVNVEQSIKTERRRIERDVQDSFSVGGELCVMLLAELTYFYMHEPYYMAVRGAITLRRYRLSVLGYMELSVQERSDRIKSILSERLRRDMNRDVKIKILRYFLSTYPSRMKEFKKLLTREEFVTLYGQISHH